MKRILVSAIVALMAVCAWAESPRFNVATYNLRQKNGLDQANGNGWERRAPIVAKLIQFHDFDIFGTQEGFKSQLDDLIEAMPGYAYIGVGRDDGKESGEYAAIFYRTALFDLMDHGDFWLSETPDRPGLGWDAACVRVCTWGRFRHKPSGREFLFVNLHMDHVGKVARVESAKLIKRKIQEFGLELPIFLTGDFNVNQDSPSYATIIEGGMLGDAHDKADFVYQLNGTFNSYKSNKYSDSRIDHIFVTPDVHVEKYGVLTDTYRTPEVAQDAPSTDPKQYRIRMPSDHFPVKAVVCLPPCN